MKPLEECLIQYTIYMCFHRFLLVESPGLSCQKMQINILLLCFIQKMSTMCRTCVTKTARVTNINLIFHTKKKTNRMYFQGQIRTRGIG